jgi:hypothetical protein
MGIDPMARKIEGRPDPRLKTGVPDGVPNVGRMGVPDGGWTGCQMGWPDMVPNGARRVPCH